MEQKQGIIAILDALGAASYTDLEISKFLASRERVLELLKRSAFATEIRGDINAKRVTTFTFNDTVLIVYLTPQSASLNDVKHFCLLLRKFSVDSLAQGILFRGSVSVGPFYVDEETNTVMGKAVTDAAAWYDSADWVGINTTPHATFVIEALMEEGRDKLGHVLVDYPVPLKDQQPVVLKALNWPKAFYVKGLKPCADGENPRAKCLALLAQQGVPRGAESKQCNSLKFFDHCVMLWREEKNKKKPTHQGNT